MNICVGALERAPYDDRWVYELKAEIIFLKLDKTPERRGKNKRRNEDVKSIEEWNELKFLPLDIAQYFGLCLWKFTQVVNHSICYKKLFTEGPLIF